MYAGRWVIVKRVVFSRIQAICLFNRFCQGCFTIDVFITGYLDNSGIFAGFFQFDNCNVLAFLIGYQRLYDKELNLALLFIDHPQIINITIPIQVEVVNFICFSIE
jgi:hypothetical protein